MADFERLRADWFSFDEALARILAAASPMPETDLAPLRALGRSLARPVRARATLPAWPNSAMDGYAVRSGELVGRDPAAEVRLPVAGRSYPGSVPLEDIAPGAAVRVMTGGPLPLGFDSVIRVEHTDAEDTPGFVILRRLDDVGKHVRGAGKDMRAGDETVAAGAVVHSGTLPVIAASGSERVPVFRRPRVGVLSSGDELVGTDRFEQVIAGRGIPDTNRGMIAAAVVEVGGEPVDLGIAPDDPSGLESRLASLEGIDLLVTTGGASMGEKDLLKRSSSGSPSGSTSGGHGCVPAARSPSGTFAPARGRSCRSSVCPAIRHPPLSPSTFSWRPFCEPGWGRRGRRG